MSAADRQAAAGLRQADRKVATPGPPAGEPDEGNEVADRKRKGQRDDDPRSIRPMTPGRTPTLTTATAAPVRNRRKAAARRDPRYIGGGSVQARR